DRAECAEHQSIVEDEEYRGRGEGEAERKSENRDLAVMGEQECGEGAEPLVVVWLRVKRVAERLGGCRRIAATGQAFRNDAVEPAGIAADQQISKHRSAERQQDAEHRLAPQAAHRIRPPTHEETAKLAP